VNEIFGIYHHFLSFNCKLVIIVATPSDFFQGMCSKIGCVISNFSARFLKKAIDYVNRVKIFT